MSDAYFQPGMPLSSLVKPCFTFPGPRKAHFLLALCIPPAPHRTNIPRALETRPWGCNLMSEQTRAVTAHCDHGILRFHVLSAHLWSRAVSHRWASCSARFRARMMAPFLWLAMGCCVGLSGRKNRIGGPSIRYFLDSLHPSTLLTLPRYHQNL